jgi:hypothetical protein
MQNLKLFYFLMMVHVTWSLALNDLMTVNKELERIEKKVIVAWYRALLR